ncbi:caspase-8-like [Aquarana catesbeiana]|uniref:caspase-8-like n=1 Tax=Aquarana catesbeiana TaxID=8400 RepID=UPI003CC95B07
MNQELQAKLLNIAEALDDQAVKELVFCCGDNINTKKKRDIHDAQSLFEHLQEKVLVSEKDLSFLKEILCKIGRNDILTKHLSVTQEELEELQKSPRHISPYRSMLYDISQELDSEDVKKVKFHMYPEKAKLKKTESMLDVLTEMERDTFLSESNLEKLKGTLAVIGRKDLHQKVQSYENQGRQAKCLDSTQEKKPIQENPTNQPEELKDDSGRGKNLEQYILDKKPHGWCVIVNNKDFENGEKRIGTDEDAGAIRRVFKNRGYTVEEHKNLTAEKMLDIMKEYQKKDHAKKDSFICFILSHGGLGTVLGVDGEKVRIKDLTRCFNGRHCESLIGKPKVFFIQACRGDELDGGVSYEGDGSTSTYECDRGSLPIAADFLTAYASTEDYKSLRGPKGSIYIQKLCKILEDPHHIQEDLKNILTILQEDIGDELYNVKDEGVIQPGKQMPSHTSELRKKLILPPPENI